MNFLSFFKRAQPEKGPAKESRDRKRPVSLRSLLGAARTGRLESSWDTNPVTADAYIFQHWKTLVARARNGCESYDHGRKYLQLVRDNVVGEGFVLSSTPRDFDGKKDKVAENAIERAFKKWSRKKNFDYTGANCRADFERLVAASIAKDGEVIILKHYGKSAGPWGFSVELIDPFLLDPTHYEKLPNGNIVRHGIEFGPDGGRPLAYWFIEQQEWQVGYTYTKERKRIEAKNVIHWFMTEMPGQKRGLPWTRTALWRMRMASGFEDAALTNARVSAGKMGFFKGGDDDIEDLEIDAEPGTFEDIGDRELQEWNPQFPNGETEPFLRAMHRSIAASLHVSYHNLSGDLTSVNFSSIRQGALDERGTWRALQNSMIENVVVPIFEDWLEYSLLKGAITLPNGRALPFEKIDKFQECSFTGKRWAWIDPRSEAAAAQILIDQKIRSRSEVIRELTNRDPSETWEEIAAENLEIEGLGLIIPRPAGQKPEPEGKESKDENSAEDEE
ncbi:MAG TPA: phage portal protein [Chthoniobacteraceae bacterium]|nr:phage portal protein [Chthoniobacteraceae bacterium]